MTEEASNFYSKGAEKFAENYSIQNISEEYIELLEAFIEKAQNGKVLDAGCGPGRDSQLLSDKGFDVTGVDLSEEMIEIAEKKSGDFHVMDVRDLDFDDASFDAVLVNQLLVFFKGEERRKAFSELSRVLKSGGTLFLGLKKGKGKFIREKYGSSVAQYPMTEEKARQMLQDFEIHRVEVTEREGDQPGFMNFIATKK
ncbi:class I SAM-dependent methyltransferase [Candidatus Nanosalina sp. VS9-1]|uniref:class I SAM-dependent methyltransferase n=1 Tax=Candidatus Nanosalina sp. VS9-1 TaxID=3388566 RepID=UPI0039DF396F